ncbi:hypothetical protein MOP88_13540 [Sphingomonas sp. WKB10]|nr:hypothetical protein [Sphingomonas sp. WKB10]
MSIALMYGIHAAPSTAYLPQDSWRNARHKRRVANVIDILVERIGAKLYERNLTEREASIDATGKPDALRYIRTRKAMPSADRLDKIAQTLGTTSDYLLGRLISTLKLRLQTNPSAVSRRLPQAPEKSTYLRKRTRI